MATVIEKIEKKEVVNPEEEGTTALSPSRRKSEEMAAKRAERKNRTKFGQSERKLGLSPEADEYFRSKGEAYRWFNDTKDRLSRAEGLDWRFVTKDEIPIGGIGKPGDTTVSENLGNRVSQVVGREDDGKEIVAYLMAIPQEFYDDDQREKTQKVLDKEAAITRGEDAMGAPGDKEGRYIPKPGISIKRNQTR